MNDFEEKTHLAVTTGRQSMARNEDVDITHSAATILSDSDLHQLTRSQLLSPIPSSNLTETTKPVHQVSFIIVFDPEEDDFDSAEFTFDDEDSFYLTPEVIGTGFDISGCDSKAQVSDVLRLPEANIALLQSIFVQNVDRSGAIASGSTESRAPVETYSMLFEEVQYKYMYNQFTECFEIVNHLRLDSSESVTVSNSEDLNPKAPRTSKMRSTTMHLGNLLHQYGRERLSSSFNPSATNSKIQIRMTSSKHDPNKTKNLAHSSPSTSRDVDIGFSVVYGDRVGTSVVVNKQTAGTQPSRKTYNAMNTPSSGDLEVEVDDYEAFMKAVSEIKITLEYDTERRSYDSLNVATHQESFMIRLDKEDRKSFNQNPILEEDDASPGDMGTEEA